MAPEASHSSSLRHDAKVSKCARAPVIAATLGYRPPVEPCQPDPSAKLRRRPARVPCHRRRREGSRGAIAVDWPEHAGVEATANSPSTRRRAPPGVARPRPRVRPRGVPADAVVSSARRQDAHVRASSAGQLRRGDGRLPGRCRLEGLQGQCAGSFSAGRHHRAQHGRPRRAVGVGQPSCAQTRPHVGHAGNTPRGNARCPLRRVTAWKRPPPGLGLVGAASATASVAWPALAAAARRLLEPGGRPHAAGIRRPDPRRQKHRAPRLHPLELPASPGRLQARRRSTSLLS
jgi:hypothetical protein